MMHQQRNGVIQEIYLFSPRVLFGSKSAKNRSFFRNRASKCNIIALIPKNRQKYTVRYLLRVHKIAYKHN